MQQNTNRDISASYDDKIYNITLADHQSSSDNKKVEINDNIITITNTGTYIIKGKLTDGQIVVDADGDGIDSNGYLQQTGGDITVYGAENNGNGALDYSISSKITGGNMIAFGYSGMAQGFGANSTQGSVLIHFDSETTDAFILTDSKNNQIITAKTDKKYNSVAVSTKEIEKGKTYTASAGSQSKTIKMNEITYTDTSAFENGKPNGKGKPDDNEVEGGKPENNDKMPNDNPPPEPPNGNNENQNAA